MRDLAVNAFQIMGPRTADHDGVVHWGLVRSGLQGLRMHPSVYRRGWIGKRVGSHAESNMGCEQSLPSLNAGRS
jgi:hypothetical protein